MTKKKRSKEIEYAVRYLSEVKKETSKNISLELGLAEAIVDGILNEQPEVSNPRVSKTQDMMIRHTLAKKTNNVSIMTEAASQNNDEFVKNVSLQNHSRTANNSIFRPNG